MPLWLGKFPLFNRSLNLHKFPIFGLRCVVSFSTSTPDISIFDHLVNRHQFPPKCASKIVSSTEFIYKPQNADSVLNFLKGTGFTKNQIEAVVQKEPTVLSFKVERSLKPKIMVFQELGFHPTELADIISANPRLLRRSADYLQKSTLMLKNVLGHSADFRKFLMHRRAFETNFDRTLVPNIEYLKSFGICSSQIASHVLKYPLVYLTDTDNFKDTVTRVDEMGVHRDSKMFLYAVRVMRSMTREKWDQKLELFRELGFSEQNILHVFRRVAPAFAVSERKIKETMQLLLTEANVDISYIARHPELLIYSVEKRLKPRIRVVKALESKKLLKKRLSLCSVCGISDAKFIEKYVTPYLDDVGDLYAASQCS